MDLSARTDARYPRHAAFVAPARERAQVWRLILGMILAAAIYLGLAAGLMGLVYLWYGPFIAGGLMLAMERGNSPGAVILLLWTFLFLAVAAFAVTRGLHGRRAGTLFGPSPRAVIRDGLRVALPLVALNAALLPFNLMLPGAAPNLPLSAFLALLPLTLPLLLVQTGAEEIFFRGYLQQQLAARYRARAVWMALPSLIFGAFHYAPVQYGSAAVPIVLWAALYGALSADLTARTGNLGAAIGMHFANNTLGLLLVGTEGNLDGLALWSVPYDPAGPSTGVLVGVDVARIVISWLVARLILRV